jgi:hypothetical protein
MCKIFFRDIFSSSEGPNLLFDSVLDVIAITFRFKSVLEIRNTKIWKRML